MSYQQVTDAWGVPRRVEWWRGMDGGKVYPAFEYGKFSSRDNYSRRAVFDEGRVVYCEGRQLTRDGDVFFDDHAAGPALLQRFGVPQPLGFCGSWWPDTGVLVRALDLREPRWPVHGIGLRAVDRPIAWHFLPGGNVFVGGFLASLPPSAPMGFPTSEPWLEPYSEVWTIDGVALGTRQTSKQRASAEVQYSRTGWVRGVTGRRLSCAAHRWQSCGEMDWSYELEAGQARSPHRASDHPHVHMQTRDGRYVRFDLRCDDDDLFEALDRATERAGTGPAFLEGRAHAKDQGQRRRAVL